MKPTGNSAHARCQKGGVPEEAEIYLRLIHFKKVWYYGQFQRGRREKISKKEKEKGKKTRKKEDGKDESKKSKAHLIHSGPTSRSPAPSGNYWYYCYHYLLLLMILHTDDTLSFLPSFTTINNTLIPVISAGGGRSGVRAWVYKVGLALLAPLFSVFFLPCPFSFCLFLLAIFSRLPCSNWP